MTIKTLASRGVPNRAIARQLSVSEGTVRYHRRRLAEQAVDGRSRQPHRAQPLHEAIALWIDRHGTSNLAALHEWLVGEHGYAGSLRSIQRYVGTHWPPPPKRARRRVETPPGAQAQVDWATFPGMRIGGEVLTLQAFHLLLSHSRHGAVVWMYRQDMLSWLEAHNEAFRRLGGVPAVLRVDNVKTAVARGAGSWGVLNATYQRYALGVRFHVDPCTPYSPQHKGKVERAVRSQRQGEDPTAREWESLQALQRRTDELMLKRARRSICPATGSSVWEAWQAERRHLGELPELPRPFDTVATRQVGTDALVSFEGRQYSVPFRWLGRQVEVRGCAGEIEVVAEGRVVARHARHTHQRLLIDPGHYEGPATATVLPPTPLGRMGRQLQQLAAMPVEHRPLDLYAALAEVAR